MKKAFLLLTLLMSFTTASFAILPCYEPFANSVGLFPTGTSYAAGAAGWHQTNAQGDFWYEINMNSAGPTIYLTNFSLSYPGLPASPGNAIVLTNAAGRGMRMTTANPQITESQNGTKVYYSMLVSVPNIANLSSSGDYCWGFNNGSGDQGNQPSDVHARVYFKKNGTGYQVGIARTTSVAYDPTIHSTSETLFLVVSYEIVTTNSTGASSTTNDICRLWVNPSSSTFGAATPPAENTNTIVFTDADEANNLNTFIFLNRATTQPNILIVDDFRLGTNWSFVTGAAGVKTVPPASASVAFGDTLSLTTVAAGSSTVNYQWQFNGTNIDGATTTSLTITNMADANAGNYSSIVSTAIGSPVTNTTTVTVTGDPQFVLQPVNASTPTGGSASFTVSATGTPGLTYRWFENGNPIADGTSFTGTVFSGSQTTNLSLSSISLNDNGAQFSCVVTNGIAVTATSSIVTLTVQDPVILSGPSDATVNYQAAANFNVAAGGTAPFGYQWYYNGSPLTDGPSPSGSGATISGSSTSNLTVSGVTYLDSSSSYFVIVTNANNNTVQSPSATLTVLDPYIATEPTPETNSAGSTVSFTVVASGTPTLSYQWYQNNNPLTDGNTVAGGGTISGSTTPTLTISGISNANAGSYYVSIFGGSGFSINSTTNSLTVINPITITHAPDSRVERAGDHLAFAIGVTGTAPTFQWQFNGTNITGATTSSLVLTNIQDASNGTYSVQVVNSISTNSASATLAVVDSIVLPLASTNLIVARIGDGAQANNTKGNTIYLDQFTTNGTYVSTAQVPDENVGQPYGTGSIGTVYGSPALLAQGGTGDSLNSMLLTVSSDTQYLNFAAYCEQYPFAGSDVTIGGAAFLRGLASVDAFGIYSLTYTNQGLYNGGNHTIRSAVTLDNTNFWTTGQAGSVGGVKFMNITDGSIATGNGIPTIASSTTGPNSVQIVNGTLIFSDAAGSTGLYACAGLPEPLSGTTSSSMILSEGGLPGDFAFSPDGATVYIADAQSYGGTNVQAGGIQRWDTNTAGSGWIYSYTLAPVPNGATNGAQGLTVYFPTNISTWGAGVTGAVLYATTYGSTGNSLSQIVDNGPASTATVLATAGPRQGFRGVRFGPSPIPVSIASQPQSQTNVPNSSVTFTVGATGSQPVYYQWQYNGTDIPGATQSSFTTNNISFASGGNYTVIVSNLVPSSVTSATALLTVTAGAPTFTTGVQSYVEGAGDHLAFAPQINGSTPISAQWYFNSATNPIPGATNLYLALTNVQPSQSGTYLLYIANLYGSNNSSGTLTVKSAPVPLSGNNIVVSRIGDGVQPLSGATGNTLYLDQYTTSGAYVSSLQVPDEGTGLPYGTGSATSDGMPFGSPALLVMGSNIPPANDAPLEGLLSLSADRQTITFAGYCQAYPFAGSDVSTSTGNGGDDWRGIGSVNAFGEYSLVYTNTGLYSLGNHVIHSAVTSDETNYWTTGAAGSIGVKWVTPSFEPAGGNGLTMVAGSDAGTRQIRIFNGNLFFTDSVGNGNQGAGLYEISGEQTNSSSASIVIAESNSPVDFAISPDQQTIYIADNSAFGGTNVSAGGIQRWDEDPNIGGYTNSYTLAVGSTAGARGLVVDFSAQSTWGRGVVGAKIYATTAEPSGNRLVSLVDNGPASVPATVTTAGSSSTLSGVSFGPVILPVSIAVEPQNQTALTGTGAEFAVVATGTAPIFYQWQFNGANIANATDSSLTVSPAQAVVPGTYSVIVSNLAPSIATSGPVAISFENILTFFGNGSGWSSNSQAGSGLPLYGYNGGSNIVELTQGVGHQASGTFYQYPVYVGGFLASWTYQVVNPAQPIADGMAFVVQNDARGAAALGDTSFQNGGSLGYGTPGPITNSAALEFDIFTNASHGEGIALETNGATGSYISTAPVDLGSGDPINVTVEYLNGLASVTLFDTVTSNTFTANAPINVPAAVGGQQAFVGFTGADGGSVSTQTVSNFVYVSLVDVTATATGSALTLTWPVGVGGFTLQQNGDLNTPNWAAVTNAVSVVNGSNQVIVPINSTNNFYRLVNP